MSQSLLATATSWRIIPSSSVELAIDDRILLEYQQVLSRPKFGFAPTDLYQLIFFIKITGLSMSSWPLKIQLPDPKDQPFLEVARAANADAIVTGNMKHFPTVSGQSNQFFDGFYIRLRLCISSQSWSQVVQTFTGYLDCRNVWCGV